jgi:5-methylthioadenosine/S-adenosylhomocysteine deaminase
VVTPGFVNVHTHAILSMVRGVAEDLGFAPAYTPGIPHGHDVTPDEAHALSRLGAVEAMLFGSTLVNDTYVHADLTLPAMADLGLRVTSGRIRRRLSLIGDGRWSTTARSASTRSAGALSPTGGTARTAGGPAMQLRTHDTCSDAAARHAAESARRGHRSTPTSRRAAKSRAGRSALGRTPAQLLEEVGSLNDHLLAAHCIWMDDTDIARCGRAGIHVAHIEGQRDRRHRTDLEASPRVHG